MCGANFPILLHVRLIHTLHLQITNFKFQNGYLSYIFYINVIVMKLEKMEVKDNDICISIEKSNELQTSAKRIKEC